MGLSLISLPLSTCMAVETRTIHLHKTLSLTLEIVCLLAPVTSVIGAFYNHFKATTLLLARDAWISTMSTSNHHHDDNNNGNEWNAEGQRRAVAWDPKSPSTLLVPFLAPTEGGDDSDDARFAAANQSFAMNSIISDSGVGCNAFESSALMNLLDARDTHISNCNAIRGNGNATSDSFRALRELSKNYRKALSECIHNWMDDIDVQTDRGNMPSLEKEENLELLQVANGITHLSEIFLLLPTVQDTNASMGVFDYNQDTVNTPGAVTADMIRYLRLHHLGEANSQFDQSVVEEMQNSLQPDQWNEGDVYWKLIEGFMIRGCLEDAWALLSHHSIVQRVTFYEQQRLQIEMPGDYHAASLAEDKEGFLALKDILLSAPIPGGRNSDSDAGFGDDDEDGLFGNNDVGKDSRINSSVVEEEFIEGVPTSAYRLWETTTDGRGLGDYPVMFDPHAAFQVYEVWKQAIRTIPALQRLRSRIPQLNKLLELLCGDFRHLGFNSWEEELCAELLYKIPNIRLVDMNVRAARVMEKYSDPPKAFEQAILNIMKGNAGRVIQVMHDLGGGSGAALPAVMTSLLCQLLDDAELLTNPSDNYCLNTELLIGASTAIRSSLASEGFYDLGTRLAVRLLLPHIKIDSDLRITANLVDTLSHHSPKSDAEADNLLSLCRKLVERKNVRVLDGCDSICLARYRYYMGEHRPGGAIHWLLTGTELESLVLCDGPKRSGAWQRSLSSGVCYRRLVADFTDTSESLLKKLIGEEIHGASLLYARAKEMIAAQEESNLASFVPAVKVLENVLSMAGAIAERKDDSSVASNIVACLEEKADDEDDGVVSSLVSPCMHWDLLRLSTAILDRDAKAGEIQGSKQAVSSFDVRGMGVLLSTFTAITNAMEMEQQLESTISPELLQQTRVTLSEGLKRAFVAENSMKVTTARRKPKTSIVGIYASNFARYGRDEQERVVKMMLEC